MSKKIKSGKVPLACLTGAKEVGQAAKEAVGKEPKALMMQ